MCSVEMVEMVACFGKGLFELGTCTTLLGFEGGIEKVWLCIGGDIEVAPAGTGAGA